MGIQVIIERVHVKKIFQRSLSNKKQGLSVAANVDVPKGHVAVYVDEMGQMKKRFVIPIAYLNHPLFQNILHLVEEEFGFEHPMGGLTIPCNENYFLNLISLIQHSL